MKILYKIWQTKGTPYSLVSVIGGTPYYRDQVISTDKQKLQILVDSLNRTAYEDRHYEILEADKTLPGAYKGDV